MPRGVALDNWMGTEAGRAAGTAGQGPAEVLTS